MTKNKYNIGDEVWIIKKAKAGAGDPIKKLVSTISYWKDYFGGNREEGYYYSFDTCAPNGPMCDQFIREDYVFPTKEALIASL